MIVGIDVHKRSHAAAIVDERGAPLATLTIANSREGARRLCRWLSEHDAEQATVGVEYAAGYGRLVCAVLAAAGHEVPERAGLARPARPTAAEPRQERFW